MAQGLAVNLDGCSIAVARSAGGCSNEGGRDRESGIDVSDIVNRPQEQCQ